MVGSSNSQFTNSFLGKILIAKLSLLVPREYSVTFVTFNKSYISSSTLGVAVAVTANNGIDGNVSFIILSS